MRDISAHIFKYPVPWQ